MTVEASLLTVLILFLLMAVIYLLFFLHDCTVLQSYGLRTAEDLLWQRDEINFGQPPVFMLKITDVCLDTEKNIVTEILNLAGSRETAQVRIRGELPVSISGSAVFTGTTMNAGISGNMIRVCYVEDRLKALLLQRQKDEDR